MKSSLPASQQHVSIGSSTPQKKLAQPIFEDDKRKIQTDSDAAIEGLMSLKSVAQNIPQNDGASNGLDAYQSAEKRRRLY
jgi:hypothetical protein